MAGLKRTLKNAPDNMRAQDNPEIQHMATLAESRPCAALVVVHTSSLIHWQLWRPRTCAHSASINGPLLERIVVVDEYRPVKVHRRVEVARDEAHSIPNLVFGVCGHVQARVFVGHPQH